MGKGTLWDSWQFCELAQPIWRAVWQTVLKTPKTHTHFDRAILLPGIFFLRKKLEVNTKMNNSLPFTECSLCARQYAKHFALNSFRTAAMYDELSYYCVHFQVGKVRLKEVL